MKALLLILGLACSAYAGNITVAGSFSGLNNTDPSITIAEGEAQDTLNVEVSKDSLSLRKRKGYTSLANLTTSTMPVTGSVNFKSSAGDNIKLFAQDSYVSKSVNGGAFTNIITSATVGAKYSFCVSDGKAYAFNDKQDVPWSYDGSGVTYYPDMPKASLCAMTVDRMLLAGTTDFPNRLYFSQSGGITNFTVDINPEDPGFESVGLPGEKITAIFATQTEWLVFKTNAFITYQGSNQFDLVRSVISERVGMIDPHAIVQNEGIVYFKASDGRFYGYTSGAITEISGKIDGVVASITRDETTTGSYTNKTEFDTGTFYNTTSSAIAGSVEPLSYNYIDTLTADFSAGTVSSVTVGTDEITLVDQPHGSFLNMGAEKGDISGWDAIGTISAWGPSASYGNFGIQMFNTGGGALYPKIEILDVNGIVIYETFFITAGEHTILESEIASEDIKIRIRCWTPNPLNPNSSYITSHLFKKGDIKYTTGGTCQGGYTGIGDLDFDMPEIGLISSGTFTSQVDTITAPVPHQGYFISDSSVPSTTSIDYFVRYSSAVAGPFTDWIATTNYYLLTGTTNQYWQYKANFYNTSSYLKPTIYAAGLTFKSTGYWETPEYDMGGMTSWGLFNANSTLDSAASLTYKIAVSTYAGGTANATLESLTPGAVITASTGTYSKIRATNSFTTATETVRMDSLSYSWSRSPDKMANAFEYKGDIYFGVPYNNSLSNNRVLKFDTSSAGWNMFDIPMNSPLSIDEYVYFGSPVSGNVCQYPVGDSDNGASINSYWKSKNYIGTNPYVEKQFQTMSIIAGSDYGSSLDITYTMDTSTSTEYTISLTSSTADFVRNNRQLPIGEIGAFFNLEFGNTGANNPWTFYGASVEYTDDAWRVIPQ